MTRIPVPGELIRFIKSGKKFFVIGHKDPDGDCVGSQLALCSALRRLGKEAAACSQGPFNRPEISRYAPLLSSSFDEKEKNADIKIIIVDCSEVERVGDLRQLIEGLPMAVIDHHATADHAPSVQGPVYIDPSSPSCTILVGAVIEELGLTITKEEAELLFFGLCTDTGFFRYLDEEKGAYAFEAAVKLTNAGANPKNTFMTVNGGKSFNSRVLLGNILSRAQTFFDGRLILGYETLEETERLGKEGRDSDSLYQLLQSVTGIEAIVIIRQETAENCTVGFRSIDKIDVSAIAACFGGGGHKNAAGLSIKGSISDIKPKIMEAFAKVFSPGNAG